MKTVPNARQAVGILLFFALALTGWRMPHQCAGSLDASTRSSVADLGYLHSQRLQVAAARAVADVLGMSTGDAAGYQGDYRRQRMQIQADAEGLDRWAEHDVTHQGLLLEIRASLAALRVALNQTSGTVTSSVSPTPVPLLPALNRAESALSNYAASVSQPPPMGRNHATLGEYLRLWFLRMLFLSELAALAWLFWFDQAHIRRSDPRR